MFIYLSVFVNVEYGWFILVGDEYEICYYLNAHIVKNE
jgi:hypothetical protein